MNFISYVHDGKENYGILKDNKTSIVPMNKILDKIGQEVPSNLLQFIQIYSDNLIPSIKEALGNTSFEEIPLDDVKITAPIPYPRRNVFCLGKNYADHAVEIKSLPGNKAEVPKEPIYFTKIADPALGHKDEVYIPQEYTNLLDYEVELAIIIGKDGKNISAEEAEDYIFGYTIANDISARDIQNKHIQWFKGKSLDNACPIGPWIVDKSDIDFPVELDISCSVNSEVRQNSNTKNLIFDIPTILSDLSHGITLRAGDIILTGTPAGVGMGMDPPNLLKSGDVVECTIEKIGSLINYIKQ